MGSSLNSHLPGLSVNFERKSFFLFNGKDQSRLNCFSLFYESTQIDAFFESKPKIDAFLKIDANAQRQEYKMAS